MRNATTTAFGSAMVGSAPVLNGTSYSGLVPTFPDTASLARTSFIVVAGSWTRLNEAKTSSTDFTVDVSGYAPAAGPVVTRVRMVDVDIPCSQERIEPAWNRLYFSLGVDVGAANLTLAVNDATIVLPQQVTAVTAFETAPAGSAPWVRIFTEALAPFPIAAVTRAWASFTRSGPGAISLVGLPDGPFVLDPATLADDSAVSFRVTSLPLQTALGGPGLSRSGADVQLILTAAQVPCPSYLAQIISQLLPTCFPVCYNQLTDTFAVQACPVDGIVSGTLSEYMGFGSSGRMEKGQPLLGTGQHATPFATIRTGDPSSGTELATWVSDAMNAGNWDDDGSGNIKVIMFVPPSNTAIPIVVPAGRLTLQSLVDRITAVLNTPAGSVPQVILDLRILASIVAGGVAFTSRVGGVFGLDFANVDSVAAIRLGYDARVYLPAVTHLPSRHATPIPCPLLPAAVDVLYRTDSRELVFATAPYPQFVFTLSFVISGAPLFTSLYRLGSGFANGLQVGSYFMLVDGSSPPVQQPCVVTVVEDDGVTVLAKRLNSDTADFATGPYTCVPFAPPPLVLYLAPGGNAGVTRCIPPSLLGLQARTYEAATGRVSCPSGAVCLCQDAYVLVCLGFDSNEAEPIVGEMFYPNIPRVFAKVPRVVPFRVDFDKLFEACFPGSGRGLSYIRVRILNPDGTLYQAHGQRVSVTLRFDCRETAVELNGPGHVTVPPTDPDYAPVGRAIAAYPTFPYPQ
jgi:hypothetical protein